MVATDREPPVRALYVAPPGLCETSPRSQWLTPLAKICRRSAARHMECMTSEQILADPLQRDVQNRPAIAKRNVRPCVVQEVTGGLGKPALQQKAAFQFRASLLRLEECSLAAKLRAGR